MAYGRQGNIRKSKRQAPSLIGRELLLEMHYGQIITAWETAQGNKYKAGI